MASQTVIQMQPPPSILIYSFCNSWDTAFWFWSSLRFWGSFWLSSSKFWFNIDHIYNTITPSYNTYFAWFLQHINFRNCYCMNKSRIQTLSCATTIFHVRHSCSEEKMVRLLEWFLSKHKNYNKNPFEFTEMKPSRAKQWHQTSALSSWLVTPYKSKWIKPSS